MMPNPLGLKPKAGPDTASGSDPPAHLAPKLLGDLGREERGEEAGQEEGGGEGLRGGRGSRKTISAFSVIFGKYYKWGLFQSQGSGSSGIRRRGLSATGPDSLRPAHAKAVPVLGTARSAGRKRGQRASARRQAQVKGGQQRASCRPSYAEVRERTGRGEEAAAATRPITRSLLMNTVHGAMMR